MVPGFHGSSVASSLNAGVIVTVVPFSPPWNAHGEIDAETLGLIEKFHLTNYLPTAGLPGTPPTDPLTTDQVPIDDVTAALRQIRFAERYNRLVVFSGHTIGNADDQWLSEEDFRMIVTHLEESDIEVVTPTEYWSIATDALP